MIDLQIPFLFFGNNSWIRLSQLQTLGIKEEYAYFVIILIGVLLIYLVVQPFIQWFIALKLFGILGYIISSLTLLAAFFIFVILSGIHHDDQLLLFLLKSVFQTLALFGIALIIIHTFQRIFRKKKRKNRQKYIPNNQNT